MKLFVVFALCVASATARSYGAPQIRFRSLEPVIREAPYAQAIRAEPLLVKEAPVYEQPAPVIRAEAYAPAPVVRAEAYAPAPVVRAEAYAPAPVEIRRVKAFVPIVKYSMDDDAYGTYNMQVETGDGSLTSEVGSLKNGPEGAFNVKQGEYSYTVDGQTFTTRWIADENGYRAFGSHLPTSVPMPQELADAYAEVAARPVELPAERIVEQTYAPAPVVRVEEPIVRVQQNYAPAPVVRVEEPIVRIQHNYAPAPVVRVAEPIVRVQQNYAPAPVVRVAEPIVRVQQNYAPAPVVHVEEPVVQVEQNYAPAPVVRIEEPRAYGLPAVRVAPTSYAIRSEGY